jgi:hypothetical protein
MTNLQNASLVLSTNNGTSNTTRTSTTWTNIDLRTLLGDMYNKYDMFNICLNTIATAPSVNNFMSVAADLQTMVRVSGIPFINNTYNIGSNYNSNTANCVIGTFTFANGTYATQYFYGSNIATFGKNQDICNITIDYVRLSDLLAPQVSGVNTFPHTTFIFDIFGIDKDDKNENGTRISIK